jgi:hypothetical protein
MKYVIIGAIVGFAVLMWALCRGAALAERAAEEMRRLEP